MIPVPDVTPELPARSWRVVLALLGRLPQGALSRAFGQVADVGIPVALRRRVLTTFARGVGIDLAEVELPLEEYPTLNAFFVRRLRPGVRRWPDRPGVLASPVDAVAGQVGRVREGQILQAKGRSYSAAQLLASEEEAARYDGGSFLTLYLSPRDYHRIHTPCPGVIDLARHVPGALFPVNAAAVAHVPGLFARNERLLCYVEGELGRVAVVAVGAYNVGRVSAVFDPAWRATATRGSWATNRRGARLETHRYDPPVPMQTGGEIMAFHLGSTVVLLLEPGAPPLRPDLRPGQRVWLGEPLSV